MQCKFGQIMNPDYRHLHIEVLNLMVFSVYMYVKERKTRECVLRIPSVIVKATKWCVGITVEKGWSRVGARTGTLKNPTKCLWRWEPDRRSNFFFSPPAHICAVTYVSRHDKTRLVEFLRHKRKRR